MPKKITNRFSVSYLQILDENGKVDKKLEPKIPEEDLISMYRWMVLAREFDERMLKLQRQGRIGTFGPSIGQEAAHCVPACLMNEKDWMVGAFREVGARLIRGETMEQSLYFYNGYEEGSEKPKGSNILPVSIIVGAQTLHAVGVGYSLKYRNVKDAAVVTFFGDGATSEGDFHEAMNFAGVWQAPVVFICQNNQWAISLPRHKQTRSVTIAQKGIAYDVPGIQVDGNDPLAMYVAAKEALERARNGGGPTLIEAVTFRMMMHTTADDPTKYRTDKEVEGWKPKDPLIRMKKYLEYKDIWNDAMEEEMRSEVRKEIDKAVKNFEAKTGFDSSILFDHTYGDRHYTLNEEKAEFLAEQAKETANG
ncbi:MAG: pyruvate dehydrogenase (acetyl-transferring) E1 component subunit alpha [Candidatus Hatepunaea meridiana]|nr:pyruvate dehydrogenase (acetyl-transferring) E1 component subunit alpha [Candidatus Hatepunaea meridiana]